MSVRNRTRRSWDYRTLCDFGNSLRRSVVSRHYSRTAAENAFKKLKKVYSPESLLPERMLYRCWQEDRTGNIINDTGVVVYG